MDSTANNSLLAHNAGRALAPRLQLRVSGGQKRAGETVHNSLQEALTLRPAPFLGLKALGKVSFPKTIGGLMRK